MAEKSLPHTARDRGSEEVNAAYPDQTLWRQLTEAETDEVFCQGWLALQARMIDGVGSGMVVLGPPDAGPFIPVAFWPADYRDHAKYAGVVERALRERKGILVRGATNGGQTPSGKVEFLIAYPIRAAGRLCGVAAFEVLNPPHDQLQSIMRQVQWGVAWLENLVLRNEAARDAHVRQRLTTALDLAAVALQEERFQAAATAFVTALATRLDCERVSVGFVRGKHLRVVALSHSAQFNRQMNVIRCISAAMSESVDQQIILVYPRSSEAEAAIVKAHSELAGQVGGGAICTIPFLDSTGRAYGALTLERPGDKPFDPGGVDFCRNVVALVAPILEEKRNNDRLLIRKVGESIRQQTEKLVGAGHVAVKLAVAGLLLLIVFFSLAKGDYRVTAKTTIEGIVRRAVVAPFNGYIYEARVRAGDTVKEGEVMCALDDRDLRLQQVKWLSQREQYLRQYREAMAEGKRANMKVLREQLNQAEAQLELLEDQIARARIVAPFAGVVVSGDLSQSIGSPAEHGQVLFEVTPLQAYRVKLHVDEREISQMKIGQHGDLVLNSLPETHLPIRVEKITPVSAATEGRNYFLVEARLMRTNNRLRPGMEGFGKVTVDRRRLIWIWTHELVDWVRLKLWSLWP